jgi:hypothetical protein
MSKTPQYTLETAVKFARLFEVLFAPDYHIPLGGSCLHRGESDKDIDLYVYPDSEMVMSTADSAFIIKKIKEIGGEIKNVYLRVPMKKDYANKPFIQFILKGYHIDMFFVQWESIDTTPSKYEDKTESYGSYDDVPF